MPKSPDADLSRRALLSAAVWGAGLAAGARAAEQPRPMADGDEAMWARVRRRFPLRSGLVHLNSANLAPASGPVLDAERAVLRDINGDPSFENRAKFEASTEATRRSIAKLLRADKDEIAITRNTSESNRTVIAGLDLGPKDEVVIWAQNHESNSMAWDVWAARYGFKVVRVETPPDPRDPKELIKAFLSNVTKRTRVLAFSHVANLTGVALPARAICRAAAKRDVLTLVDGAQTFGMMDLDVHDLGCDFYTASGHKWLAGPQETGVLYVRHPRIARLWPSMVTHNWPAMSQAGARKYECLGQRQEGRIAAMRTAVDLQIDLGRDRVERRIRELTRALRDGVGQAIRGVRFLTPSSPELSAGILAFVVDAPDARRVMRILYERFQVSALAVPYEGKTLVRFSPNIYTSHDDVTVAIEAIAKASRA